MTKVNLMVVLLMIFSVNIQAQEQKDKSSQFYNAIKSEPDPLKQEKLLVEWEQLSGSGAGSGPGIDLVDFSRQLVAQSFSDENNFVKAKYWIARVKDPATKITSELNLIRTLLSKNELKEAEQLLEPLYSRLKAEKGTKAESGMRGIFPMPTAADCEPVYALLSYKKGEYKKALEILSPGQGSDKGGIASEIYALSLAKSGDTDRAIEVMSKMVLAPGHRSDDFKATAKKLFVKKYGTDIKFRQLLDSALAIEQKKIETKVAAMKVNEPAPDFELSNLDGKRLSLKSLRGKTVILDFWATWCQPCVASFPGMQKAVDYYRNDTSVVFMFIHTLEKNENPAEDVRQFMNYKKYRFDVYMDLKDKLTKQSPVVASYKVRGIPAKFVIDKNGMIRFKNSGYISEDEAIPEIKMMIDMARKDAE